MNEPLVEVRLLNLPLREMQDSSQHHDELFREFRLITGDTESGEVPHRLLHLISEVNEQFGSFAASQEAEMSLAAAEGKKNVDLVYRVPPAAGEATRRLAELLADADEYCRQGDLLTLASPPPAVRFRNWYLGEFMRQIEGQPPIPWTDEVANVG